MLSPSGVSSSARVLVIALGLGTVFGAAAACGARTPLAQGEPAADASLAVDATPPRPCHLVSVGEPFRSIVGPTPTAWFRHDGLLASGASRVVQFGDVEGFRTGVWQDPPIFAAEYDVTSWPPVTVHPATSWAESMHPPADLLALPDGRLDLTFWFDNDGVGPSGVRTRPIDAASFKPGAERFLAENATVGAPPVLAGDSVAALLHRTVTEDGGSRLESRLARFDFDGNARPDALVLWSATPGHDPAEATARTRSDLLVALAFSTCDGVRGAPCEIGTIVLQRLRTDGTTRLEKVGSVALQGAGRALSMPRIATDRGTQNWLTWWEQTPLDAGAPEMYLFGIRLSSAGVPQGAVETWWSGTDVHPSAFDARQIECGALGTIYPVRRLVTVDGGGPFSETHFVHRPIDDGAIEELVVTTQSTYSAPVGVAVATPRAFVVGDSSSSAGGPSFGELRKWVCAED